jgi:hypothetical protein
LGGTASVSGATCAMRIYSSPLDVMDGKTPHSPARQTPGGERFRICEVPKVRVLLSSGTKATDGRNFALVERAELRGGVRHSTETKRA